MEPLSIDAVVVDTPEQMTPTEPATPSGGIPIARPKLKGRQRFFNSLQRISSSPSLPKVGRSSSSGYRIGDRASISCVSLSSSSTPYASYGSSYSSEMSAVYSTAPTSTTNSPSPDSPISNEKARLRLVGSDNPTIAALPPDIRPASRLGELPELDDDYFTSRIAESKLQKKKKKRDLRFWEDMPFEVRLEIFRYLKPKEIIRCSAVSKTWYKMCFDGQLWSRMDTSDYYQDIPADALVKIITSAGPFVRDLNLRGCVQLRERWNAKGLVDACRNLENFSLEGCKIDRASVHCFLLQNSRLVHLNLSGLAAATNSALKIISQNCPKLEHLNISWCNNIDTRGIRRIIDGCPNLKDLRAGEIRGWDDLEFVDEIFKSNSLERLVLMHCDTLSDESLETLVAGLESEVDVLSGLPIVPPRRLKHLDLTRCRGISDKGIKKLIHNIPNLEGLQLGKCHSLTDDSLIELLPTLPRLTHLDLEELEELTNSTLQTLASAPCAPYLSHLSVSYCESLGDSGMLPLLKNCSRITSLDMDNTRISDLTLAEAASIVRSRNRLSRPTPVSKRPTIGLRIVAYDCANVTWTGVREILSRNAEMLRPSPLNPTAPCTYPREIIALKCFYNWQPTIEEHTKRVLRGDFAAAVRLERKWADWMMFNEEAGVGGGRRRRRRAREAQLLHANEEEGGTATVANGVGGGRRRRARSGPSGCVIM